MNILRPKGLSAFLLLITLPFSSFAEIPDSCSVNYNTFLNILKDKNLSSQQITDSSLRVVNWDWKLASETNINQISEICEERIEASASLEEKAPLHNLLRHIYQHSGRIGKAVVKYEKLIAIYTVLQDTAEILASYHYLSFMYHDNGLFEECLIAYRPSIELMQHMEPDFTLAHYKWSFGYLHSVAGWELGKPNYQDSAVYYIGQAYNFVTQDMGDVHVEWTITYAMALARNGQKREAIRVANIGLEKAEELGDLLYIARFNKQLSQYYQSLEMKDSAYYYIFRSAETEFKMYPNGHPHEIKVGKEKSLHMYNIYFLISIYDHFGETDKLINLLDRIIDGPDQIADYHTLMDYRGTAASAYYRHGYFEKAAYNYQLYQSYSDSLNRATLNQSKEVKAAQLESQISLEKERAEIEQQQQEELDKKEKENLRTIIYSVIAGSVIVVFFLMIVYRRFKVTSRQKDLIETQKTLVEEAYGQLGKKNKEILDSINYATRIQNAILPSKQIMEEYLPNSFVIYLPKDIVAGDFYWLEEKNGRILFAAGDCTGHGVPGAMVSVICNNGLNRSVREHGITEPSQILEKTREIVIAEFEKSEEEMTDGMDIALCSLKGKSLQYAGAHNPLWIIRNGSNEIEEINADKQPIGKFYYSSPFTPHEVEVNEGDQIYIFTDGFSDQFGGERGKKYYSANFQSFLLSIKDLPLDKQKEALISEFERWKGNREQIDDICIIGVKI